MPSKFKIGDRVVIRRINERTPKEMLDAMRLDNPRTVTSIFYDDKTQHNRYYLGSNNRQDIDLWNIPFRASELKKWRRGKIGHPRVKRRYRKRSVKWQRIVVIDCEQNKNDISVKNT